MYAAVSNYIKEFLKKLKDAVPIEPIIVQHKWYELVYRQNIQSKNEADVSPLLDQKGICYI